jgi:hypothetical protein
VVDIVTFDGPNKIITEIAGGNPNELDVIEIYSEWKAWTQLSDNLKFLQAFSVVGGDPISPTQNLGATFFLENGWRIRPAESDHKLTLIGNLFTREPGQSVFIPTLGAFTVNTETRVSNLVDSSVARLDLNQLLQAIYIDSISGSPGTSDDVGTPTNPSNNIADARTLADIRNLNGYVFRGTYTLLEDHLRWSFQGQAATFNDVINVGGFSVDNCRFTQITITGSMSGKIEADRCNLEILTGLSGVLRRCALNQNITLAANLQTTFDSCYSDVPGAGTPAVTFGADSAMSLRNYSGGIQINSMTTGCVASLDMDPGHVTIDSSCTGGILLVRGMGRITRNDAGAVTVIDFGFLSAEEMSIVYHAVAGNAEVSINDQTVTIKDEAGATLRVLSVSADGRVRSIV